MINSLDEEIKHLEEVAEKYDRIANTFEYSDCRECAKEYRQLAEWLRELKKWRDFGNNIGRVLGRHFSEEELFKMMEINADE